MARTISTKLAVEGEAQYKQAIAACNQQLSTLKSQLALTESEFRGQANSMEALRAKGQALQGMYDQQASKIEQIRKALENCEKAQQEYARRVAEAEDNIYAYEASLEQLKNTAGDTTEEQKKLQDGLSQWQRELAEATAGQEAAERGAQNWQRQLNYAGIELNDLSDRIQQNNQYLEEAANSTDGCAESIDEYGKAAKDAGDASEEFEEESVSAVDALAQAMVAAGIADKAKEMAEAIYDCVKTYGEFESQMSAVQSISGATGAEMEALTQKAQEMGQTTSFTAKEAGQALEYMAMAGWKTNEMLDGLDGIMNLAAASGEDLATVSDIVTDGLTAFGLAAEDSAHFADVLASASANSNTNVSTLGESFSYVAPVAGALGYSLEDVTVALGLMANAGIKGSAAGTALRGTLTNLTKPSRQVATYMEELGISLTDSAGQMKPLSQLLGELREKFRGLTEAQKAEYAAGIAGKEAMSGLLAVVNASDADFNKLTQAINNCNGEAERMAQIRLDNFEGQVTLLNSAIDGLKMTIGGQLAPVLELLAKGATTAVGGLNLLLEQCPALSAILAGLVASAGAFVTALTGFTVLKTITPLLKAFNVALAANPAGAAAIAVVGVVTALGTLAASCVDAKNGVSGLNKQMQEIDKTYKESETQTIATATAANTLIDKLAALESQQSMTEGEAALYAQTVDQLRAMLPELNIELDEQTGLLIGGTEALKQQVEAWKENAIAQAMQEKYAAVLQGQADALIAVAEKQLSYNDALATCTDLERQMEQVSAELQQVENNSSLTYDEKAMRVSELSQKMGDLSNQYVAAKDNLSAQNAEMEKAKNIASAFDSEVEKLSRLQASMRGEFESSGEAMQNFEGYADSVVEKMSSLESAYYEAAEAALESIEDQFNLWDDLSGKVDSSEIDIEKALKSQERYWNELADNIRNLSNRSIEGVDSLVNALNDGSVEGAAAIASLASKNDSELQRIVKQYDSTKEAQARWAGEAGNIVAGYSKQVSALSDQMVSDVQRMDLYGPAMQAGANTIQGYINGVNSNRGSLSAALRSAANDAWSSFKQTIGINSPSKAFRESGHDSMDGYILGVEDDEAALARQMEKTAKKAVLSFEDAIPAVAEAERRLFVQASQSVTLEAAVNEAQAALSIVNHFDMRGTVVREEADINRIARELYAMQVREMRGRGLRL